MVRPSLAHQNRSGEIEEARKMGRTYRGKKLYKLLKGTAGYDDCGVGPFKGRYAGQYGHMDYARLLPQRGRPGPWTKEVTGTIELCTRGYHAWVGLSTVHSKGNIGNLVYECEIDRVRDGNKYSNKVAGGRLRLLRLVQINWNRMIVEAKEGPSRMLAAVLRKRRSK
jgi:hypothetical protein